MQAKYDALNPQICNSNPLFSAELLHVLADYHQGTEANVYLEYAAYQYALANRPVQVYQVLRRLLSHGPSLLLLQRAQEPDLQIKNPSYHRILFTDFKCHLSIQDVPNRRSHQSAPDMQSIQPPPQPNRHAFLTHRDQSEPFNTQQRQHPESANVFRTHAHTMC